MKRFLFSALAVLSFHNAVQAEITESNVAIQFKKYIQLPQEEGPTGVYTTKVMVSPFKTADAIQQIGIGLGKSFTSKAKLVYRVTVTANSASADFIIRDLNTDHIVTTSIGIDSPVHITNGSSQVAQGKVKGSPPVGTTKFFGYSRLTITPDTTTPKLQMHGPITNNQRTVLSKEFENKTYAFVTATFSGIGTFGFPSATSQPNEGSIQGTFKITGPKLVLNN